MKNDLNPQENILKETKIGNIKHDFPKGTIYEKELMTNFKYFNIFGMILIKQMISIFLKIVLKMFD